MQEAELEVLLKPILELYTQIEIELLENIASRFDNYPTIDGSLEWYLDKMQEFGAFKQTNVKILAKYAGLSSKELKHLMEELVFRSALEFKGANLNALLNSTANRNTLSSILNNLENDIKIINTKALESAEKSYMDVLTKSTIETTSGAYSYQESIKHGLMEMAEKGISGATYERSNGKIVRYSLEGTVRRDILTRAHQASFETQMNNMRELGHNLIYVSQHKGARVHKTNPIANHAGWQGKVYMLDGSSSEYPNLFEATGYGDIQGLAGVNCRHHISSYIEGVTKLPTRVNEEENERIYQESQEQRKLERDVRKAKKELAVAKKIDDKDLIKKAKGKLKQRTEKLNDFVDNHPDMRRDYARTRTIEEHEKMSKNTQIRGAETKINEPTIAGEHAGKPMAHEEADSGKVNPNFNDTGVDGYKTNCQTCVAVYEARRRGFNVEAHPNNKSHPELEKLSHASWSIWCKKDGTKITRKDFLINTIADNKMDNVSFYKLMQEKLVPNARYTMRYQYAGTGIHSSGHIVNLLTDKNNAITIYDAQSNTVVQGDVNIMSYLNRVKWSQVVQGVKHNTQPGILRVDDKEIDYNIANKVMRKAK